MKRFILACASTALLLTGCTGQTAATAPVATPASPQPLVTPQNIQATVPQPHPTVDPLPEVKNVVLILADDLDTDLFNQIPRLAALKDQGMTLSNMTVTDSLCCPSRASIFTGQQVHNHNVASNVHSTGGGWEQFKFLGLHEDCLPIWLQDAGVRTGFIGKYLNEFPLKTNRKEVPPGWDRWVAPAKHGVGYKGYNYPLNVDGKITKFGDKPKDYLGDQLIKQSERFITESAEDGRPFFLEVAPFVPHSPFSYAPRHENAHKDTTIPRTENFNAAPPMWMPERQQLDDTAIARMDGLWSQRARSAEGFADTIDSVLQTLDRTGMRDETLVIITSDNGFHAATHTLPLGKRTPYREDTVVPTVVIGPGVPAGTTYTGVTAMTDLAPTISALMGATYPDSVDGFDISHTLATGEKPAGGRTAALSESLKISTPDDPDYTPFAPPMFVSLRTENWLIVRFETGQVSIFDLTVDPAELDDIAPILHPSIVNTLLTRLTEAVRCQGDTCRQVLSEPDPVHGS